MEPISTAAIALGSVIATKALEKTGEKFGETIWNKTEKFLNSLQKDSPETVTAIERLPQQPLDYGKAVLEIDSAAKANPELAKTMTDLEAAVQTEPLPNLANILNEIIKALGSSSLKQQINIKQIEKINNFAQGNIYIKEQHNTF